ncbi:hypothetical protein A2U01_0074538 [Trifolium medium]|uniref:Uncharacterized protein n=1 Tax=Trifolium medium TaxID=97028 RepID=A0A392SXV0_9FABA|nr:hypothetical protein [Trifolium medium]
MYSSMMEEDEGEDDGGGR